jgi:hypothetical protein
VHRRQVWAHLKSFLPPSCSDFDSGSPDASAHDVHTSPGLPRFGITGIVLASVLAVLCIAATIGEQSRQLSHSIWYLHGGLHLALICNMYVLS